MQPPTCLNCGTVLLPNQKYCSGCGQKAEFRRITMKRLVLDFIHTTTHTDRGLLNLFKGLATSPGKTAAAYVEGRRKAYFNPFGFLALCVAFMLFMNQWIKPYPELPVPDTKVLSRISDEHIKQLYIASVERIASLQNFLNKNMNLLLVLTIPFFAFFLWLFFRSRKRNMAEINVAYVFFTGFSNVASSVIFAPWLSMVRDTSSYYYVFWSISFIQTLYFAWGLKTFFNYRHASGYFSVLAALMLIGLIGFIILFTGLFIYVYHGETFKVLQYL